MRADALDQAGAEVLLDALDGVRRRGPQLVGLELQAVIAVLRPVARGFEILPSGHGRQVADDGDQPAPPLDLHAQHREPVLRVVKGDAFDGAGEGFGHGVILHFCQWAGHTSGPGIPVGRAYQWAGHSCPG